MLVCAPWPLEVVIVAMVESAARRPRNADGLDDFHKTFQSAWVILKCGANRRGGISQVLGWIRKRGKTRLRSGS